MRAPALALALFSILRGAVQLDVPFVRQEKNGCGSAVLSMLIGYWQHQGAAVPAAAADARGIQQTLYSKQARGIYASELAGYLERNQFRVIAFRGTWDDLAEHLDKGRPLIVSLRRSRLHYVVVAGIDRDNGIVMVNDPAGRKLAKLDRASFERDWHERWTLLAVPKSIQ